jgi:hypothetical protein
MARSAAQYSEQGFVGKVSLAPDGHGKSVECAFFIEVGAQVLREIVLINITGEDRPGLTAAITGVLFRAV